MADEILVYFPPQSTSALDQWSDRAIRICLWQFNFAAGQVFLQTSSYLERTNIKIERPLMPTSKLLVAILPIFLPIATCFFNLTKDASQRTPVEPLFFCSAQLMQLAVCSFLTASDFVKLGPSNVIFWISFFYWFVLASIGFIYALVGIARFYLASPAQRTLYHDSTVPHEYSDEEEQDGPLALAYQLQHAEEIVPSSPASITNHDDAGPVSNPASVPGRCSGCNSTSCLAGASASDSSSNPACNSIPLNTVPASEAHFRWQEVSGARNGGAQVWSPITFAGSLSLMWGVYYRYVMSNSAYSPQLVRAIILQCIVPMIFTSLSSIFVKWSIKRPQRGRILATFCLCCLTIVVWMAVFIYLLRSFFYHPPKLSFWSLLIDFAIFSIPLNSAWCHFLLLRCLVKIEWTPDYSSLSKRFYLWRQHRGDIVSATPYIEV